MLLLLFVFVVVDVVRVVSRVNGYQQGVFWKLRLTEKNLYQNFIQCVA